MNALESTLFNDVPVVSELNRVAGFDPLKFLKKTVNGYELELRYKKLWFRLKYPAGRTRLTPLRITDQLAIIEAKVFFDKDDADPASSYIATMTQENAPAGLYIQAAEHDALDMALTNAGFGMNKNDLLLLTGICFCRFTQQEMAKYFGLSQRGISKRICRLKKLLQ